uniref:Uncharacterized protein n=1 Tax=Onchocerca volvulus TaxID=6282 RepID=A0A8R1TQ45_ONCVO
MTSQKMRKWARYIAVPARQRPKSVAKLNCSWRHAKKPFMAWNVGVLDAKIQKPTCMMREEQRRWLVDE